MEVTYPTYEDIETETPEIISHTFCERLHMAIEHENQSEKKKEITIFEQKGIRAMKQ
jgi:hypothetical protein